MKSIEVMDEISQFIEFNLSEICSELKLSYDIHYSSNLQGELNRSKMTVYVARQVFREEQDTLAVDVIDLGRRRYTSYGAMLISFFMPRTIKNGYINMEKVVQKLKNKMRQEQFKCMWVRDVTASPHDIENNSYRYDLTFTYQFDEIV